jgi:hypothetical protein
VHSIIFATIILWHTLHVWTTDKSFLL